MNGEVRTRTCVGLLACVSLIQVSGFTCEDVPVEGRYWDAAGIYRAPDYGTFFPDCRQGAEILSAWWTAPDREKRSAEGLSALRHGLHRYEGDRATLLRWMGRRYIDRARPQDPAAVEIMYHAADINAPAELRGPAIRFGLTALRPMTPNVLKTLAALSIDTENPDELGAIARGIDPQRDEAVRALAVYLESGDAAVREKAASVRQIWHLELKAHEWARARNREQIEAAFGNELPAIRKSLLSGTSAERLKTLDLIFRNEILSIVPDSALAWFARCATDPEALVRAPVARMIGERWILTASNQDPVAVNLLLKLSEDASPAVRYNATYYGLAVVSPKDDALILRLMRVAGAEADSTLSKRVAWGLRAYRPRIRFLLQERIASGNADQWVTETQWYRSMRP